jgi:hypothetical protein
MSGNGGGGDGAAKKRRKKLVERTTIDANGYMCTETVTEWEDVEDEDYNGNNATELGSLKMSSSAKASGGTSKTSGGGSGGVNNKPKKQAGLMGFFGKKAAK